MILFSPFRAAVPVQPGHTLSTSACLAGVLMSCTVLSPVPAHAADIAYGYDGLGRLTSVTVAGDTAHYDYDAAGNITAARRDGTQSTTRPTNESQAKLVVPAPQQ
jgi:YD repeat-containing protein